MVAWGEAVIEAVTDIVPMIKPQSAFYEALGADGYRALDLTIRTAKNAGLLALLDAKRGDIGSTAEAYAEAGLSSHRLDADAMTVNPYFGVDGISPFLQHVAAGKGIFIVVHSSNPSAASTQDVTLADGSQYFARIAALVAEWGAQSIGDTGYSSVGAIVGATFPDQLASLRRGYPTVPILIPGYGTQGGRPEDVVHGFGATPGGAIVSASRSMYELPGGGGLTRGEFVDLVEGRARSMVQAIAGATSAVHADG